MAKEGRELMNVNNETYKIIPVGDMGVSIQFEQVISESVNDRVIELSARVREELKAGIIGMVPSYCSLLIYYEPNEIAYQEILTTLKKLLNEKTAAGTSQAKVIHIPVCYDASFGPDLNFVASKNNLSESEVIKIHSNSYYRIYMLGFTPGFPYLGGMDKKIATPRLAAPRTKIPAGSVGIAGEQTGIYPLESPGGWRLIGRTPVKLYNPDSMSPFLLRAGDYIKFEPIDQSVYETILNNHDYVCPFEFCDRGVL